MATKILPGDLIAAGAAMRHVDKLGIEPTDIKRVTLDGDELDVAAAQQAVAEAESRPPPGDDGFMGRVITRFERAASAAKPKLETSRLGRVVLKLLSEDPETVVRKGVVTLELRNGSQLRIPVNIVDPSASKWLQCTSALVEVVGIPVGLIPFLPNVVSGGMAIASGLASLFADAIGRRDLGGALRATAMKHVALTLTSIVPGLGEIIAAYSLLLDQSNLRRLNGPVSVEEVVGLASVQPLAS